MFSRAKCPFFTSVVCSVLYIILNSSRDKLYASLASNIEAFQFDEQVTGVFADMIRRSVPGYASVIAMTGVLSAEYVKANTRVYDLGCSLGTSLMAAHDRLKVPCELIGADSSPAMISACEQNLAKLPTNENIKTTLLCEDICNVPIENASMVIMNYTLQFIAPSKRLALLEKIADGLKPGGVLVLSEKLAFEDAAIDAALTRLYYDFKKHNGYSDLEISQKRQALENVLIPETESTHLRRLTKAGFSESMSWFQCLNFHSFVAFKAP